MYICELGYKKKPGEDRWGYFHNFTGNEEKGHCFWCGIETKRGRYCSKQHAYLYRTFYCKDEAYANVYRRIYDPIRKGYICEKCNNGFGNRFSIDVHHIMPINGGDRYWNILNRPENLLGLCHECHKETHRIMFKFKVGRKVKIETENRLIIEKQMLEIQPELF